MNFAQEIETQIRARRVAKRGWVMLSGILISFAVSCGRDRTTVQPLRDKTIEERVDDLEKHINEQAPRMSETEAHKQYEADLAEIRKMGMADRAVRDFRASHPTASIEAWDIRYFVHTNAIWCDFRFRTPEAEETKQVEFGYERKTGTNWTLMNTSH